MFKKVFFISITSLVFSLCMSNVYAHSISGHLNASATKCTVKQTVSGSGVITTHIKCYEATRVPQYHLFKNSSTVYGSGNRTVIFEADNGYKFLCEYNGYKGNIYVTLGSSTVAYANISY